MSPERNQNSITIEEITSKAKEIVLRDGNHVPTLIMETSDKLVASQVPSMPVTHGERMEFMRFIGQTAAKSGKVDLLQQVFLVHEGWMSMLSEDEPAQLIPSQDPERKEVLIISAFQIKESKRHLKVFEILRDAKEQVVGFEEFLPDEKKKDVSAQTPLLDAFVEGFETAFRSKFS
jgi:hypothetical protein